RKGDLHLLEASAFGGLKTRDRASITQKYGARSSNLTRFTAGRRIRTSVRQQQILMRTNVRYNYVRDPLAGGIGGRRRDAIEQTDEASARDPRVPDRRGTGQRVCAICPGNRGRPWPPLSIHGAPAPHGSRAQRMHQTPRGENESTGSCRQVPGAQGR